MKLGANLWSTFPLPFWAAPRGAWHKYGGMQAAGSHPARQGTGPGTARSTGKRPQQGKRVRILWICFRQETSVTVELSQCGLQWKGLSTAPGKAVA